MGIMDVNKSDNVEHHEDAEKIIDRLGKVIKALRTNETQVCMKSGISIGNFAYVRKNDTDLSRRNSGRFLAAYPNVNPSWFLTGEGEMFLSGEGEECPSAPAGTSVTDTECLATLRDTIQYQQTLIISQQETIKELVSLLHGGK